MNLTPQLALIRRAMLAADGRFPKATTKAIADRDKLAAAVRNLPVASLGEVSDAVAECLLAGRDPIADETVSRLLASRTLAGTTGEGLRYGVAQAGERRIVRALEQDADAIIATLVKAANTLGEKLTAAFQIIGDHDLRDATAILNAGGVDASRAWAEAQTAIQEIRVIDRGWLATVELARLRGHADSAVRLADLTLEQFEQVGRKADPWDIVRAGVRIQLAHPDTVQERVQRLTQEREQRQAQHAGAFALSARRHFGASTPRDAA